MTRRAEKQLPLAPGLAVLVDLLVEFAVDDFFATLDNPPDQVPEASRALPELLAKKRR